MFNFCLDLVRETNLLKKAKEGDDREITLEIYKDGVPYNLVGSIIVLKGANQLGGGVTQTENISIKDNVATIQLDRNFTRVPGNVELEATISKSGKQITTFTFNLIVKESVLTGADLKPTLVVDTIEVLTNKIIEAVKCKEETEQLIATGNAATKGDIATITSQLEHNTNQINVLKPQVQSLASGSPKGVYITVSALTTAFPSGNTNVYVVTADGGWYYWNGTAWTKGGTYQSTGLSDTSVSRVKIDSDFEKDFTYIENGKAKVSILEELTKTNGYIKNDGTFQNDPNYVYSNAYIIDSTKEFYIELRGQSIVNAISFYDMNGIFISGIVSPYANYNTVYKAYINVPTKAYFVRFSWAERYNNGANTFGDAKIYKIKEVVNDLNVIKNELVESTNIFENFKLFASIVGYIGSDGTTIYTDSNWVRSDFIDVSKGNIVNYTLYGHTAISSLTTYDSLKKVLRKFSAQNTTSPIIGEIEILENEKYVRVSYASEVVYPTKISSITSTQTIKKSVFSLKDDVENLKTVIGSKEIIPYVPPKKVYTVCNDVIPNKKGHNRNYASAIYLDHMFNGFTTEKNIRFANGIDKVVFTSPITVTDANETNPTIQWNGGSNILSTTKNIKITGNDIIDSNFDITHISTLNSITKNVTPKVLCIGDSITYGELAEVNDDEHSQNLAYHLMCKEFFTKDKIDNGNSGYDIRFLGHYQKNRTMKYNGVDYPITTYHEGIRGISLNSYLNGGVSDFKDTNTNKFSINAWLSKYRTLDDNGNRLALGSGTGTLITSGNLNSIDVCTPTHVLIMLGANGGGTIEQYKELVNIIKTEYPNMVIGITVPDSAGTYFPSLHQNCDEKMIIWNDIGSQGSRHNQMYGLVNMLQNEFCTTAYENQEIYFVPFYFVQPTAESCSMRKVDLPDSEIRLTHNNTFNASYGWHASTHVNGIGHINWGYQLYSWIKYTIAKKI